jgi:hypothetical protein
VGLSWFASDILKNEEEAKISAPGVVQAFSGAMQTVDQTVIILDSQGKVVSVSGSVWDDPTLRDELLATGADFAAGLKAMSALGLLGLPDDQDIESLLEKLKRGEDFTVEHRLFGQWDGGSGSGWAGYFIGNVNISGHLYASAKDFRIDDPLDPAHKYLQHTSVESPDMMNIYNGNVTTDGHGFATIAMPRYFQALNRTFRYQLTIVGTRGWNARVVKEIAGNRFTIQTDQPSVKVSWQVTGIRHDPYANANRTAVEVRKPSADQGRYIHPELYGKPRRLGENRVLAATGHTP